MRAAEPRSPARVRHAGGLPPRDLGAGRRGRLAGTAGATGTGSLMTGSDAGRRATEPGLLRIASTSGVVIMTPAAKPTPSRTCCLNPTGQFQR